MTFHHPTANLGGATGPVLTSAPEGVPPLGDASFRAALYALEPRYWDRHPFHTRLHQGLLGKDELQLWAANRWYYQRCIPQKDSAILANCPLPEVRRQWLPRIVHHDGVDAGTEAGTRGTGDTGGAEKWLRLAEALGLSRTEVLATSTVLDALPLRDLIDRYTPWRWTPLKPATDHELSAGLTVTAHPIGSKSPNFVDSPAAEAAWVSAYRIEDRRSGGSLLYAPCFGTWSALLDTLVAGVDCALLDGTFHSADELGIRAPGAPAQRSMGHLPVSGPDGSLAALARHPRVRRVYTHLNNTNPLLDPDSPARAELAAAGVELLPDGAELLPQPPHRV